MRYFGTEGTEEYMQIIKCLKEDQHILYTIKTTDGTLLEHRLPIDTPSDKVIKILSIVEEYNAHKI